MQLNNSHAQSSGDAPILAHCESLTAALLRMEDGMRITYRSEAAALRHNSARLSHARRLRQSIMA